MKATTNKQIISKGQEATDKAFVDIANAKTPEAKEQAIKDGAKAIVEIVKEFKAKDKMVKQYVKEGGNPEDFNVDKNAEGVKQHNKPSKGKANPKKLTCSEAMGIVMKANPNASAEVIINKADTLFIKSTGTKSNLFQMGKYYRFASQFLKGYNK
jgi:hypothetical protein